MAATKPIPVRLSESIMQRLDLAAGSMGNSRAGVIRLLVDTFLTDFEQHGKAMLPPDWKELMKATDHRTKEAQQNQSPALKERVNSPSTRPNQAVVAAAGGSPYKSESAHNNPRRKTLLKRSGQTAAVPPPSTPPPGP